MELSVEVWAAVLLGIFIIGLLFVLLWASKKGNDLTFFVALPTLLIATIFFVAILIGGEVDEPVRCACGCCGVMG